MTFLVTGAAGFIGSHLCKVLLKTGCHIVGIDNFDPFYNKKIKEQNIKEILNNKNFNFHELDICENLSILENYKIDIVIHFASKVGVIDSIDKADAYSLTNINGTLNLLNFMKQTGCDKILFSSSSSVYGNNQLDIFTEDYPANFPLSPYAVSKRSCEIMLYNYHYLFKINVVCLRLFSVYGPNQRPDLFIHKISKLIISDLPVIIYGKGDSSRDYTFISDVIGGIISAIDYLENNKNVYEIINIGNKKPVNILFLVHQLYQLFQIPPKIIYTNSKKVEMPFTNADIKKSKILLNYNPKVELSEGLMLFHKWFMLNLDAHE